MDDADDLQELELERAFRARDELLQSLAAGILRDIEQDNFQEAELAIDMWMEVLGMRPWKTDDRPPAQECHVCLELVKVDKRPCCGLPVCQDCMKKYVETQMREAGVVRIGCPNSACGRFISQEEVREMLKYMPELRDRYDRWLVDLNADPQRKTCPRCCRITEIEALDRRTAGKYGVLINCPDCELNWCFPCQAPWHEGVTCAKNKAGDELLKRWARQRKTANEYNAQRCPKCKIYIQRISGCDHMQCRQCDTKFCYRCGERRFKLKMFGYRLEDHDMKHSIIGCKHKYDHNKPLRRMFTRGGIFGAKVVGGLVAVPVICGVALAALPVAAPIYGVYRLAKHVRHVRSRPSRRQTDDMDSVWSATFDYSVTDINLSDDDYVFSPSPPIPGNDVSPRRADLVENVDIEASEEPLLLPTPLPPRKPLSRWSSVSERRRRVSMDVDPDTFNYDWTDERTGEDYIPIWEICSLLPVLPDDISPQYVELVENVDIEVSEEPVLSPPLPPRQPIYRWSSTSQRRRPPPVPTSSSLDDITSHQHDWTGPAASPETVPELTHL